MYNECSHRTRRRSIHEADSSLHRRPASQCCPALQGDRRSQEGAQDRWVQESSHRSEYKRVSIYWWENAQKEKIILDKEGPYVLLSKEQYDHLEDVREKFWAIMDEINCEFEDMFPEWGE